MSVGVRHTDWVDREKQNNDVVFNFFHFDGFESLGKVNVLIITNRICTVNSSLLKPGRLNDKVKFDLHALRDSFDIHLSQFVWK